MSKASAARVHRRLRSPTVRTGHQCQALEFVGSASSDGFRLAPADRNALCMFARCACGRSFQVEFTIAEAGELYRRIGHYLELMPPPVVAASTPSRH